MTLEARVAWPYTREAMLKFRFPLGGGGGVIPFPTTQIIISCKVVDAINWPPQSPESWYLSSECWAPELLSLFSVEG